MNTRLIFLFISVLLSLIVAVSCYIVFSYLGVTGQAITIFLPTLLVLIVVSITCLLFSRHRRNLNLQQFIRNKMIEAQETERANISRELHDGIGQALYSTLVGLKIIKNLKLERFIHDHLLDMEATLENALHEVKRMSTALRPSALDDLGLVPAMRSYITKFERHYGIQVNFQYNNDKQRYATNVETALYRIMQEALTNAAKYAETSRMVVQLTDSAEKLSLIIADEGKGMKKSPFMNIHRKGHGLYNMKERAEAIGGSIHIQTKSGKGTRIEVIINKANMEAPNDEDH